MKIGFIGLGIMGLPMARNILKHGYDLTVYTHKKETIDLLVKEGAKASSSSTDLASKVDVVITMLPDSKDVEEVVNELLEQDNKFTLIDMSSIDPTVTKKLGKILKEKGMDMLDAPVSGGEPKAIDGTLSVMVGGDESVFNKYNNLLHTMASSVTLVGNLGSGNICKLANQMIVANNIRVVAEALTFAKKCGANPTKVVEAIKGGLAGSEVLNAKAKMMIEGNLNPGFRVALHIKDLKNALNASHAVGASSPMTAEALEVLESVSTLGGASLDHSAMIKYYELINGISLKDE